MKKILVACVMFLATVVTASAARDGKPITMNQLPDAAQTFLKTHFADKTPAFVSKEKKLLGVEYTVYYVDNVTVEFNSSGEWTEVECKRSAVPATLVPEAITKLVKSTYPTAVIKKIDTMKRFWEVELDNGIELRFDQQFNLIGFDD